MRNKSWLTLLKVALPLFSVVACTAAAHAQILSPVRADIHHPFVVGSVTLPPGQYVFQVKTRFENNLMTVTDARGNKKVEVLVRSSVDSTTPRHTQLVFTRVGNMELLDHIYAGGNKYGLTVLQPTNSQELLESQMRDQGARAPVAAPQSTDIPTSAPADSSVGR